MQPTEGTPLVWAQAILEGLPDAVVAIDSDERIVLVNALAEELFGYRREELVGSAVQELWAERVRDRYTQNMRHYFATEHPLRYSEEVYGRRRDGSEFVGEMSWGVVRTAQGPLLLAIGRDVSRRVAQAARLQALADISARALEGADPAHLATEAQDRLRLPIGVPPHDLTDEELTIVRAVHNILAAAMARRRAEEQMRHDALHDPLTGLPNRTLLHDRLEHAVAQARRGSGETCVLFVDLDDFKQVNDAYGHQVGDELLARLGGRLLGAVRPTDTVARMGGDEFVVVCEQTDNAGALALAARLEAAIAQPVQAGGAEHRLSASIGIALGRGEPDALLRDADAAVYRAKAAGGARVELFSSG